MTRAEMIAHAKEQQELVGIPGAMVTFVIPGKWGNGKKRLLRTSGPMGDCVNEMPGAVVVAFCADEVIAYLDGKVKP